jgi:hypothetical protein
MAKAKKNRRGGKPKAARKTRKAAAKRRPGLGDTAIRQPDGGLIRAAEPADSNDNRRPGIKQPDGGL